MKRQASTICVVIVDNDEIFRDYVALMLARIPGVEAVQASSGKALFEILQVRQIDCILLDYNLGFESGLSIMSQIKASFGAPPPVVMLTGDNKQTTIIRAFRIGVSDYLPKQDLTPSELTRVIGDNVAKGAEARRREEEHQRLLRQSPFDPLTGLYSRSFLDDRLSQLCGRQASLGLPFALVTIDFVEWSEIAARFGSKVGDVALKSFAQRLKSVTRQGDICGRYGDATFAYVIDLNVGAEAVDNVVVRLTDELSTPIHLDQISLFATVRLGGALCPRDGSDPAALLEAASRARSRAADPAEGSEDASDRRPAASPEWTDGGPASAGLLLDAEARPAATSPVAFREVDRRRAPRQKVLKRGVILLDSSLMRIECMIRDWSPLGAKLIVNDYFSAPESFTLQVVGSGEKKRVRCRWQIKDAVGVEFV